MVVSVRSLLFDKGEYIMKLSQKKWKSLISGVLLAASASSFLIAPVYAADYSKPLIGTLKKDSEILSPDGNTVTENDGKLIYDFQGKDHTFTITNKDGITACKDSVYNNVGADGSYGTIHINQTNTKRNAYVGVNGFIANKGTVIVNSNLDITAASEYSSVGIAAANKGNLIINGNVKMRKDDAENPWGIITKNVHGNVGPGGGAASMGGDENYTGARWQPAGISVDYSRGDITINGDVDIAVRGTAVRTDVYQADGDVPAYDLGTISLLGNSIRIDTPYREENFVEGFGKFIEPYYALASYGGTINVNVKNQEAQNGKVEMVGNVLAMKSSDEAGKAMVYQNGRLNIGLTTQDSSWKGVIDNAGTAKAGEVNLWLQNGAQWIYENASRKDGLDASNLADYSRPYYEKYDGVSHMSSLVGGKDKASAGIIKVNDNDPIHIANAEGVTKVWYEHDDAAPGTIIGGDIKVLNAKAGSEMMLYTGNNGISKGFDDGDTAAEKNNVSEVLNSLAHKLWYMAGDSNLAGSVSIAEGLTASSVTMKTGNITFAEGGQGFYDYTPEKDDKTYATGPIVKSENIGETRESDINGVVSVNVTEAQDGVSGNAPRAMYAAGEAEGPLVVDLQGHTLKLNANNQTANYVSTVYVDENKSMEIKDSKGNGVLKVSAGLGADGNADTKAKYVYGIRVGEGGNLTANTDVEIDGVKSSATQRAYGVYVSTKGNVVFEKDLSIKNVQTGNKVGPNTAGIYADSSSSADAPINITVKGNLNIENVLGSAIRALNTSTISTAGATIKAADMSNGTDYSQYYALQANKGTINLNTGEGITAGILDVTGDMKVTDNKASVINVNMTKGSQWTGAVSNIPGSTYNAPAGQFNLTMVEGSVWNHETGRSVDTLKTTFAGINANGAGASVTVDGKTTIAAHGSGVVAADGATVNLGAADIEVKNNSDEAGYGFHALGAALGTVNVGGEGKTITVKGNAGLFGKQSQKFASDSKESVINLKLTTEDSAWTGVAYKHFDAEKDAGLSGSMNLTLTNGAFWTNEKYGYTYGDSEWEKYKFTGSEIADFVGGASDAKAGNIFQKDANSLTIDNYSGNTNIFYAHTGNGEAAENYAAGDTVIKHAAAGSVVSMITDNTGIAMDNQTSVNNVLNALAGKLTYSSFVNGEKNLTGYVKIADGLTASSAALKTGDITFNEADGKGGYVSAPVIPDHQVTTSFTTTLTGDKEQDNEYMMGGVIAADGTYKFTEASDITAVSAINTAKDLKIDATGKTLTVNTAGTDSAAIKVLNDGGSKVDIKADKLIIKSSSDYAGKNSGIYAGDWNTTRKNVNITADVDITATNTVGNNNNVYGVLASKADITVNGSLKANIDGGKGGYDHTSVSALIAQGSSYRKYASTITVNGDVDITANGNGLHANNNGAVVTVNGGGAITINDSSAKGGYAALRAGNGTVNMNVALENGKATGGLGKNVAIKGNLAAIKAGDQTASVINLALDTAKSSLEGVSYMTEGNGQINLWLQNGASWTNEVHGSAEKDWKGNSLFNGSHVTNFAGGASDAKAGNIFQKDANSLTIDNYSGNTNIFYAHTGNGEAAENYAAGDTVIKHAAEGSVVSMITDNSGIAMDNEYSVANVLNALAGKLTYSNFVNGEKNLTGYVKIADGLTASSKAMQTGDISFSTEDGKGSLKDGSMTPGITYPETQKPGSNVINQGITGNAKDDYQLKMDGILKEDGSYVFTQNPTKIEVKEGAAVGATDKDIVIDTTKAKLELKGATGINAEGANVNIKGNTNISGVTGINAANGNVTLNGSTVINGTDAAINAGADANVVVNGNDSALTVNGSINADGGNITVDSGKASSIIKGDINAANGGSVAINLTEKNSKLTGGYNVDGDSSIALSLANGATWNLTDGEEAAGMSLLRMAKGAADAGLTINGGKTEAEKGFLDMTDRTKTLDIAHYSGWETIFYKHENAGADVADYKSGDTIIDKAEKGSGVILSTDNSGINMKDKNAVEATLKALAQKVTYNDHEANGGNLTGKVQIADGLTSSSKAQNIGTLHWDENGKGQYDLDSVNWNKIIEGDYETFVMKGVRSAATTSLHTWRDNMQDTYTGADMADEDGMFAKALGGKTSSDVKGLKDSNTYYGVQVGYDKAAANGWHTGVAFDYRNGDSNYLLGGKGDNQMYSLGVYGVKNFENDAFFRVAAKVGRVENEYDVYNEIRSLKLNGDYKANAYGLTMEYGKTFGDEEAYFTPKAQLTWSQVGAKDYTAHTDNATMQISQDSYSSFVGRLGFEAGVKSEKGRVYAGLFAAHEFNGDISASYFANDGDRKHTSFDGEETWMEMKLGGTYDFSNNAHLYADIAKDFNGNFERKWKMNVGLRFEF